MDTIRKYMHNDSSTYRSAKGGDGLNRDAIFKSSGIYRGEAIVLRAIKNSYDRAPKCRAPEVSWVGFLWYACGYNLTVTE